MHGSGLAKIAEWRRMKEGAGPAPAADDPTPSAMDVKVTPRFWTRARLLGSTLALAVLVVTAWGYVRYGLTRSLTLDAGRVQVSTVEAGVFNDFIPVTARVEPRDTVYLDAVDGGQVAEVYVEEGALVQAGQPLVRLSNTNLQLEVIAREAQISEQLNRLASTKLQFEQTRLTHARELVDTRYRIEQARQQQRRYDALNGTGAIRRSDLEDLALEIQRLTSLERELVTASDTDTRLQAEQVEQLDQAVESLTENLTLARRNLESLVVRAPFDGQLTALEAHLGESKQRGQRLGQVDRLGRYKATAWIDEHYLARVSAGQTADGDIGGAVHRLTLAKVYAEVRDRQFRVDLDFPEQAPDALRRGQTLQLRLAIGAASEGLLVGNGPWYDDTGGQWAFVVDGSGTATRRAVGLGRRNLEHVEVLSGLTAGERIVISAYDQFLDLDQLHLTGEP